MQIRPFEELEAMARERYRKKYASVPEPKVINVDALVQFTAPREFTWGGVGLRAPPLGFVAGVRLMVAANAIRDLRLAQAPPGFSQAAVVTAAALIRQTVVPLTRFRRLRWRWSGMFAHDEPEAVEGLLRWLLDVPDQAPNPPATVQVTLDFMDAFVDFVREFPAWVGPDGFPRSWAAYVYGCRNLHRSRAREDLRAAMAARAAGADVKDFKQWNNELRSAAGW